MSIKRGEISTVPSLKAVDDRIDVINANINDGVQTAFKSSKHFSALTKILQTSSTNTDSVLNLVR